MIIKEKTKSIQISENVHNLAKEYCTKRFLKLGGFIEELILKELKNLNNGK
jgi:hypothetical protein